MYTNLAMVISLWLEVFLQVNKSLGTVCLSSPVPWKLLSEISYLTWLCTLGFKTEMHLKVVPCAPLNGFDYSLPIDHSLIVEIIDYCFY